MEVMEVLRTSITSIVLLTVDQPWTEKEVSSTQWPRLLSQTRASPPRRYSPW